MTILVCCLVFYAIGLATNLFASRIFSPFFVISAGAAHSVAIYVALAVAAFVTIAAVALTFLRPKNSALKETKDKTVMDSYEKETGDKTVMPVTQMTRFAKTARKRKLLLFMTILVCCLVFYAISVATNLFASPIFSKFLILNSAAAHNIGVYVALNAAVFVAILAIAVNFLSTPGDSDEQETRDEAFMPIMQVLNENPTIVSVEFEDEKTTLEAKNSIREYEIEPTEQPIGKSRDSTRKMIANQEIHNSQLNRELNEQVKEPSPLIGKERTRKRAAKLVSDKKELTNIEEFEKDGDKKICPSCSREFTTPFLMTDYRGVTPKLMRYCPRCKTPLPEEEIGFLEQELWRKNFRT